MSQPLKPIAAGFQFNTGFIGKITEEFDDADWVRRPEAGGNHALWLVGHLAIARRGLLGILGEKLEPEPWHELFDMGSDLQSDDAYPAAEVLLEDLAAVGRQLVARLEALTEAEADAEGENKFPYGGKSLSGAAHFLHFHESYHLGQLAYIRRMGGKPGFV